MKPTPRPGIILVATRELRWMYRDRLALFLAIGVPLIAFAILAWTFSNAVIRNLNVSVVDADGTPTSRPLCPGDFFRARSETYAPFKHTDGRDAGDRLWRGYRGGLHSPEF